MAARARRALPPRRTAGAELAFERGEVVADPERPSFLKPLYTELLGLQLGSVPHGLGAPGLYEVTIVFRHPIQAAGQDDALVAVSEKEGDSGIGIPRPISLGMPTPEVPTGRFKLDLIPNKEGRLGKARATVPAQHLGHAR